MRYNSNNVLTHQITARVVKVMMHLVGTHPRVNSQEDFGKAIGVSAPILSRWIGKKNPCQLENVAAVCMVFKANPVYLILGTGEMFMENKKQTKLEEYLKDISERLSDLEAGKITRKTPEKKAQNGAKQKKLAL